VRMGRWTVMALVVFMFSCASPTKAPIEGPREEGKSAGAFFRRGVEELRSGDYLHGRVTLDKFLHEHATSELAPYVEVYLKLLNEIDAMKAINEQDQREIERLRRELQEAKLDLKRSQEKYQKEIDELKRDLEYLRELDIELQRRNRSIR